MKLLLIFAEGTAHVRHGVYSCIGTYTECRHFERKNHCVPVEPPVLNKVHETANLFEFQRAPFSLGWTEYVYTIYISIYITLLTHSGQPSRMWMTSTVFLLDKPAPSLIMEWPMLSLSGWRSSRPY